MSRRDRPSLTLDRIQRFARTATGRTHAHTLLAMCLKCPGTLFAMASRLLHAYKQSKTTKT